MRLLLIASCVSGVVLVIAAATLPLSLRWRGRLLRLRGGEAGRSRTGTHTQDRAKLALAMGGGLVGLWVTNHPWGLPVGAGTGYVLSRLRMTARNRKARGHCRQQAEYLCLSVANSLRAGQSLPEALATAAHRVGPPLAPAVLAAIGRHQAGVPLLDAFAELASQPTGSGLGHVAEVLSIHQEAGGELPLLLTLAAGTLRERRLLQKEVEARTVEARLSARILAGIPVLVTFYLAKWQPASLVPLVMYPAGRAALALAIGLWLTGLVVTSYLVGGEESWE